MRGRPIDENSTRQKIIRHISILDLEGITGTAAVNAIVEEFKVSKNTARVYYYTAKKKTRGPKVPYVRFPGSW